MEFTPYTLLTDIGWISVLLIVGNILRKLGVSSRAEAVYAAGLPDGRGLAVKINDGGSRASQIVLAQALVKDQFHRHAAVAARQDRRVGRLPDDLGAALVGADVGPPGLTAEEAVPAS